MKPARSWSIALTLLAGWTAFAAADPTLVRPAGAPPAAPAGPGDVLYSQLDDPSGYVFWDTDFFPGKDGYDAVAADDFVVTSPAGWNVENVYTVGEVDHPGQGGTLVWVNTSFYADAGGVPGAPLSGCEFPGNVDFTADANGSLSIDVDCSAPSGVVWVSQQVRTSLGGANIHWWATRNTAAGNPFVWQNPDNGWGTDCIDWTPATACGALGDDTLFEIRGEEGTAPPVPAIGPLGLALALLSLGCSSAYVLSRPRAR